MLCNARAMGEFGAVSVVSGHIRGETNTMPLQVEILYNEYQFVASFAVASLLAMLALITLVVKTILERHLDEGQLRVAIEVRNIVKKFGAFAALDDVDLKVATANWWRCSGRRARARPRCCGSSRAWNGPMRRGLVRRRERTGAAAPASATSASCSSTTRCSAT